MKMEMCCDEMGKRFGEDFWFDQNKGRFFYWSETLSAEISYCPWCGKKIYVPKAIKLTQEYKGGK